MPNTITFEWFTFPRYIIICCYQTWNQHQIVLHSLSCQLGPLYSKFPRAHKKRKSAQCKAGKINSFNSERLPTFESDACLGGAPGSSVSVQGVVNVYSWICRGRSKSNTTYSFPHLVHRVVGLLNTLGKRSPTEKWDKPNWERSLS